MWDFMAASQSPRRVGGRGGLVIEYLHFVRDGKKGVSCAPSFRLTVGVKILSDKLKSNVARPEDLAEAAGGKEAR